MGQVRWKIFIHHTISATLRSTYQNLLKLVEIGRSSERNKNAQFFWRLMTRMNSPERFPISEVAADWHEPMVGQQQRLPSIVRANGQLDPWCS